MDVASWGVLVNSLRADLLGFLAVFWNRRWRDEGTGGPPRRPSGQRSALPPQVSPGPTLPHPQAPSPPCQVEERVTAGWPGLLRRLDTTELS